MKSGGSVRVPLGLIIAATAGAALTAHVMPPDLAQSNAGAVQVTVDSADGRPTSDLTVADFEVLVGGQPRPVAGVAAPGPLTVFFIGDVSKSVVDRARTRVSTWIDPISSAADHFARSLQPGDRARLMAVAGSLFEAGPAWTADRQAIEAAARRLVPAGAPTHGSPIWDAVDMALPLFANEPGRRAIVLVTDGRASGNLTNFDDVARRAAAAGVAISIVELEATPRMLEMVGTPDVPTPSLFLRAAAAATGGTYLLARVNQEMLVHDPGPLVRSVLQQQRSSYLLTFDSTPQNSSTEPVVVRVRRAGLTAQVRHPEFVATVPTRAEATQVFRAEANLIEVTVRVTDRNGQFVSDLKPSDFELRDSRQSQPVVAFNAVNLPNGRRGPLVVAPAGPAAAAPSAVTAGRYDQRLFVLLLDDMMTSSDFVLPVRRIARQFVEDHVGVSDQVAVFSTAGFGAITQDFTTDKAQVVEVIDRFQGRAGPCGETPRAGQREKESDGEYVYRIRTATDVMASVANNLRGIRGRKVSLLWISEGIGYDVTNQSVANAIGVSGLSGESAGRDVRIVAEAMRNAIDALRRANVTLYSVDPRRLWALDLTGGAHTCEDSRRSVDVLRDFSALTGGFAAVDSNEYRTAFDRIIEESSQYYVLGFQPAPSGRPGDLRPLDVRVPTRPDARVTARPAYVVPPAAKPPATNRSN